MSIDRIIQMRDGIDNAKDKEDIRKRRIELDRYIGELGRVNLTKELPSSLTLNERKMLTDELRRLEMQKGIPFTRKVENRGIKTL